MSAPSIPQVPPRPARPEKGSAGATLGSDIPKIPPRPTGRKIDRSPSPGRDSFARSPLNDSPYMHNQGTPSRTSLYSSGSANVSQSDLPQRPSSVVLPSLGQEGSEYAEVCNADEELSSSPTQTRNIANDLKLHAPKPSLPTQTAKRRVSGVTRTDSSQAAALGLGKGSTADDKDPRSHLKTEDSFGSHNGIDRPASGMDEQGIPEIGQRVPMYPNAGDVQAPSPALNSTPYVPGIGFHNDGTKSRHHGRRTSARAIEQPPGSYGLHGHGVIPHDRFEKAYYEKHPELLHKETGHYSGALAEKAQWAMSSEDLNRIVRDTASRGAGLGTSPAVMGTPSEQIGFQASEEYTSRMASPRPESTSYHKKTLSTSSQTHTESLLRKGSFPSEEGLPKEEFENALGRSLQAPSDAALDESEVEDENTIHVDTPARRISKIYGGVSQSASVDDLGYYTPGNEEDYIEEHGYSAPILASDEVAKEPYGYELQPAVSPQHHRSGSSIDYEGYHLRSSSATSSRPTSIHGVPGLRMTDYDRDSHSTPLEDLDEYEPLFPEDEKKPAPKPETIATKLKRPDHRKFPSQDVWEDTPNSLQYTATVSTPQLPDEPSEENQHLRKLRVREGETPEQAFARRQEELAESESSDRTSFLSREKRPNSYGSHQNSSYAGLSKEIKAESKQARFPSRDVWEDSPASLQLQTTVNGPQVSEVDTPIINPPGVEPRPTTGAVVYHQEKAAAGMDMGPEEGRATTGIAAVMKPSIPARPVRAKPDPSAKPALPLTSKPTIPDRPKPHIPTRPVKGDGASGTPLTKSILASSAKSNDSLGDAAASKPKPPVPSRPVGGKIAALQSGFMSDLNKRLQLGPQAPKKDEVKEEEAEEPKEKAPLVDARKGRARGPQRRAPAAAAAAPAPSSADKAAPTLSFSTPAMLWHIRPEDGNLNVSSHEPQAPALAPAPAAAVEPVENKATQSAVPTLATNPAGESVHEPAEIAEHAAQPTVPNPIADSHAREAEEVKKEELIQAIEADTSMQDSPLKESDSPSVTAADEDMTASTGTLKAEVPAKDDVDVPTKAEEEAVVEKEQSSVPESFE